MARSAFCGQNLRLLPDTIRGGGSNLWIVSHRLRSVAPLQFLVARAVRPGCARADISLGTVSDSSASGQKMGLVCSSRLVGGSYVDADNWFSDGAHFGSHANICCRSLERSLASRNLYFSIAYRDLCALVSNQGQKVVWDDSERSGRICALKFSTSNSFWARAATPYTQASSVPCPNFISVRKFCPTSPK